MILKLSWDVPTVFPAPKMVAPGDLRSYHPVLEHVIFCAFHKINWNCLMQNFECFFSSYLFLFKEKTTQIVVYWFSFAWYSPNPGSKPSHGWLANKLCSWLLPFLLVCGSMFWIQESQLTHLYAPMCAHCRVCCGLQHTCMELNSLAYWNKLYDAAFLKTTIFLNVLEFSCWLLLVWGPHTVLRGYLLLCA